MGYELRRTMLSVLKSLSRVKYLLLPLILVSPLALAQQPPAEIPILGSGNIPPAGDPKPREVLLLPQTTPILVGAAPPASEPQSGGLLLLPQTTPILVEVLLLPQNDPNPGGGAALRNDPG